MIDYYSPHRRIWKKVIASFLVVTFLWYDIAWAGDLFYSGYQPAAAHSVPQGAAASAKTSVTIDKSSVDSEATNEQ